MRSSVRGVSDTEVAGIEPGGAVVLRVHGAVRAALLSKRLQALNPANGEPVWEYAAKRRIDSSPVVVGDRVFFGAGDGRLYCVGLARGNLLWSHEAGGSFTGSPAVAEGHLVIANDDGVVYCFGERS